VDIVGFGPIGRKLAEILASDDRLRRSFRVSSISDSSGFFAPRNASDVLMAVKSKESGRKISEIKGALPGRDKTSPGASDANVLFDVTNSDYSKPDEARDRAYSALRSGRHLISANKVALSYYFPEILDYARRKGLEVGYGATICGGRNAIVIAKNIGGEEEIIEAGAVLNASTTLILSSLEENASLTFEAACEIAAKTGVLESEWSIDLDGIDAAAKTAILSNVLFPMSKATFPKVKREGIRSESVRALLRSQRQGTEGRVRPGVVRLVSEITPQKCSVSPHMVNRSSALAVEGRFNAVSFQTKSLGEISVKNLGGGVDLTASVLISDLKRIASRVSKNSLQ